MSKMSEVLIPSPLAARRRADVTGTFGTSVTLVVSRKLKLLVSCLNILQCELIFGTISVIRMGVQRTRAASLNPNHDAMLREAGASLLLHHHQHNNDNNNAVFFSFGVHACAFFVSVYTAVAPPPHYPNYLIPRSALLPSRHASFTQCRPSEF